MNENKRAGDHSVGGKLTALEQVALVDICKDTNRLRHDRDVYTSLKAKGLITLSIGGHWMATSKGRRMSKALG